MSAELKPCPFCGSTAEVRRRKTTMVSCTGCSAATFQSHDNEHAAIEEWNRRAQQPDSDEVKAAHELLNTYCVANLENGLPLSLAGRIKELYSWYEPYAHGSQPDSERDAARLDFLEKNSAYKIGADKTLFMIGEYDVPGRVRSIREAIDAAMAAQQGEKGGA